MSDTAPFQRTLVTAALPYANGPLHIGHLAGVYLPADIYVRYLRARGQEVLFVCGSDEHGAAITLQAQKEGISPQELVDKYHPVLEKALRDFGVSFDIYHRTSSPLHHETAQAFFRYFYENGLLEEQTTEQYYDPEAGMFLADRYIRGICPVCGHPEAYGDQCENCGSSLDPTDLGNPRSSITGAALERRPTTHWYLPLNKYSTFIKNHINNVVRQRNNPIGINRWKPNVYGQMLSWLGNKKENGIDDENKNYPEKGLRPRAITRDLPWGVPVPPEIPGSEGKKLYVWFDAPIGYISATKAWAEQQGDPELYKTWWKNNDTRLIHFLGKDNIVFHTIIFPSILRGNPDAAQNAADWNWILPDNVPANEFLNLEGQKLSTSRGWAIWAHEFMEEHPDQVDVLRYVLCSTMPETKDSDFFWDDYVARNNNELVAVLGNFVNRVVTLIHKYYDGVVPPYPDNDTKFYYEITVLDKLEDEQVEENTDKLILYIGWDIKEMIASLSRFEFRKSLSYAMSISRSGNKLLQANEPWKLVKMDEEESRTKAEHVLSLSANICVFTLLAMEPFMPEKAKELAKQLNVLDLLRMFREIFYSYYRDGALEYDRHQLVNYMNKNSGFFPPGHNLNPPELLFRKLEPEFAEAQKAKLRQRAAEIAAEKATPEPAPPKTAVPPIKPEIEFPAFEQLDLRAATITAAEPVPKADKLLQLTLDVGLESRTVLSGIAQFYAPEEIVGQRVVLVANLQPRKMRGVLSQGMVLMAENPDGSLRFVAPEAGAENGAVVR